VPGEVEGKGVEGGGMTYPSVTQVLGLYQDFSKIPPERLELACERGKDVHAYCAAYAKGFWSPIPESGPGYCQSFREWFDEYVKEVYLVEKRITDKTLGFTGQLDLVARLKHDMWTTTIDYKTPLALQPVWAAQLSAYNHLVKIELSKPQWPSRCGSLRLDPKGKSAKFKEYSDSRRDFMAFQNALYAYKYFIGG
jgi:hypothetical protein